MAIGMGISAVGDDWVEGMAVVWEGKPSGMPQSVWMA